MSLAGRQLRDARFWVGLEFGELASRAGMHRDRSDCAEAMYGAPAWSEVFGYVRTGLKAAGVKFISENDGGTGAKLRKAAP